MKHSYSNSFLLVMACVTVGVVLAAYAYMSHTVGSAVAFGISAKEAVAAAEANKLRETSFMQTYQSTSAEWARLPGFFVPSNNVVSFIVALEALGPQTGATSSISAIVADDLDNASPGSLGNIHVHVDVEGSWGSVMRTLELAEILPFESSVSNLRIAVNAGAASASGKPDWKLSFDIVAAMIAVPDSVPGAASSSPAGATRSQ